MVVPDYWNAVVPDYRDAVVTMAVAEEETSRDVINALRRVASSVEDLVRLERGVYAMHTASSSAADLGLLFVLTMVLTALLCARRPRAKTVVVDATPVEANEAKPAV